MTLTLPARAPSAPRPQPSARLAGFLSVALPDIVVRVARGYRVRLPSGAEIAVSEPPTAREWEDFADALMAHARRRGLNPMWGPFRGEDVLVVTIRGKDRLFRGPDLVRALGVALLIEEALR